MQERHRGVETERAWSEKNKTNLAVIYNSDIEPSFSKWGIQSVKQSFILKINTNDIHDNKYNHLTLCSAARTQFTACSSLDWCSCMVPRRWAFLRIRHKILHKNILGEVTKCASHSTKIGFLFKIYIFYIIFSFYPISPTPSFQNKN